MDVKVIETGNGGDVFIKGADLALAWGFINMPYLALFGGNVEANSSAKRLATEQDHSWWGNMLLEPNNPKVQFNSNTERTLKSVALNSSGRLLIEQAVKKDLEFMSAFAQVTVSVDIITVDTVRIGIKIQEPDNLQEKEYIYIWDGTLRDLTATDLVYTPPAEIKEGIGYWIIGYNFKVS